MTSTNNVRILVECALMVALATMLSALSLYTLPQGGSITPCATLPIFLVSHRHGVKWGVLTGFTHSLIQTLLGMGNVMICATFAAMAGCVLLDYLLAYTVLGTLHFFEKLIPGEKLGLATGTILLGLIRFFCSFLSGILIWGAYAAEGVPVWLHSLVYNGSYMIPEIILTTAAALFLFPLLDRQRGQAGRSA